MSQDDLLKLPIFPFVLVYFVQDFIQLFSRELTLVAEQQQVFWTKKIYTPVVCESL